MADSNANLNIHTTVAEMVTDRPGRSRFFEKLGIDYCCGGKRSLEEVCSERGLDAHLLLDTLLASEAERGNDAAGAVAGTDGDLDLRDASPIQLMTHIVDTHHAFLKLELPRLSELGAHVAAHHGAREPRLSRVTDLFERLRSGLEDHLRNEEDELFPTLMQAARSPRPVAEVQGAQDATIGEILASLEDEHLTTASLLEELKELTDGYTVPEWGCNSFRAYYGGLQELELDMHRHVHKENNILFPAVQAAMEEQVEE